MEPLLRAIVILHFLLALSASGQGTLNYFEDGPIWGLGGGCNPGGIMNCYTTEAINHYVDGDTLLEGVLYHRLFERGIVTTYWTSEPPTGPCDLGTTTYDVLPLGFVRQDDMRIYWKPALDQQEQLLFDFDLHVGDTLPNTVYTSGSDVVVAHRDTIVVAGSERIRLTIANGADHLVEGIGSVHAGLLGFHGMSLGCYYSLHCFGYADTTYFPVEAASCDIGLSIGQQRLVGTRMHPNPTTGPIELALSSGLHNITIMNAMGAIVGKERAIGPTTFRSDLSALPAGVYLVRVEGNGMATTTRVIRE